MHATSRHYEQAAAQLAGKARLRALEAAQNHLDATAPDYLARWRRLQGHIIRTLVCIVKGGK